MLQGTLGYIGCTVLPPFVGYHIPYLTPEQRGGILADYRQHLAGLDQLEPLKLPVLAAYDREMRPLPSALEF